MTTETLSSSSIGVKGRINYGKLTLLQLTERIVYKSEKSALEELHENRRLFPRKHQEKVRLVEYIAAIGQSPLARRWCGYDDMVLDDAYDLCIDKFSNIPTQASAHRHAGPQGPDCRCYFGTFFDCTTAKLKTEPPANLIEAEMIAAELLRRLIKWHFFLSCLEARRKAQRLRRRYMWRIDGRTIYLWLPFELPGQRCREWLVANIPDVDPDRPGEQFRVQAIVDGLLTKRRIFYLSELDRTGEGLPPSPHSVPSMLEDEISVNGLAEAVAVEKAENIKYQTPAIRLLGEDKLRQLIRTGFARLACGNYDGQKIAACFGLSKATFSRFAGNRWGHHCDDTASAPDLWRNTAQTLANHCDFVIAAQKAGVWKQVSRVLDTRD